MTTSFRVGLVRGFADGLMAPEAVALLDAEGITHEYVDVTGGEVQTQDIAGYDAVVLLGERFGPAALVGNDRLVAVARWGVGYDTVDVEACTAHDVCVFITPDGVRRPVATALLAFMLALALRLKT